MASSGFYDMGDQLQTRLPEKSSVKERRRAVLAVASRSLDAGDAAYLLAMLGLTAEEGISETEKVA